jgi:hypothetical protein
MGAIAAHLRYISKSGRLPFEDDRGVVRDGAEALRDVADQWRHGGARIPEHSERREAFNIMLSMPMGTKPEIVRDAAREFAKAELANHRYVMVLHTHQANPHVHLAVRAEGRDGKRLNPRKHDLRRWREVFAEKLRGWGIEAEASSQVARGSQHRNERLWQRKAYDDGRIGNRGGYADAKLTPARRRRGARSQRRSRRRRRWPTASWATRSSTTRAGCRVCATSCRRNSRSVTCPACRKRWTTRPSARAAARSWSDSACPHARW